MDIVDTMDTMDTVDLVDLADLLDDLQRHGGIHSVYRVRSPHVAPAADAARS